MKTLYNIYCDESCHLLNDGNKAFVLGAVWVEKEKSQAGDCFSSSLMKSYPIAKKQVIEPIICFVL